MGTTVDNNSFALVYDATPRTATPTAERFSLRGFKGAVFVIDLTAFAVAASLTVTIRGYDRISGKVWTILTSAAITAVSTVVLRVYPGLAAVANLTVNDLLPPEFEVLVTHGNGNSHTYTVSVGLIP